MESMDVSKRLLISEHEKTLNILRCYPGEDKSVLAKLRNQSWPTLSTAINRLVDSDILIKNRDNFEVNPDAGWYVGVMTGGAQVKVVIIDFAFRIISFDKLNQIFKKYHIFEKEDFKLRATDDNKWGYIYFNTPDTYGELHEKIDSILTQVVNLNECLKGEGKSILGIGFAFTGAIDNIKRVIIKAHSLDYLGFNQLDQLINPDKSEYFIRNGIRICLDHNAKTAAVAEKYALYDKNNINHFYKDKNNILVFYLGSGLGSGLVLDNKIYRGCNNFSGEIGHIPVPCLKKDGKIIEYEKACSCGSNTCLEYRIRNDVFEMDLKTFKKQPSDILRRILVDNSEKKKLLGEYVGYALNCTVNVLNVGLVIFTGKWKALSEGTDLWNSIYEEVGNISLQYTRSNCGLILSTYGVLAPAIGAAICSSYENENEITWV